MRVPITAATALLAGGLTLLVPSLSRGMPDASVPLAPARTAGAPARAQTSPPDAAAPVKAPLSPEQAIERLLGSNHGTSELASPELRQLGEEVRRNPLAATAREDPVVQARLRKLLEAPPNPVTEQHLRRFFEAP